MVRGFAILLLMQFFGELLASTLGLPIPGSVLGMVLLLLALLAGWVRLDWLDEAAGVLLQNMALFFVPAGVGVMIYADLLAREWLAIGVGFILSTFVVMAVTGRVEQALARKGGADADSPD